MRKAAWILAAMCLVATSGCRLRAAKKRQPMSDAEFQLLGMVLPGCSPHDTSTADELIVYCPEQAVFFATKDIKERKPDKVFAKWLEELGEKAGQEVDVLQRTEIKSFGPMYTALYVKLRTAEMPEHGYVETIVALTEVNGKPRRIWCSATGSEPIGYARCEQDLPNVALLEVPR